ncbi:MAG: hypothetical protein AAF267_00225 [Deinococcota bacterium]
MLEHPFLLPLSFIVTTLVCVGWLLYSLSFKLSRAGTIIVASLLSVLMLVQGSLAASGFYFYFAAVPPRFFLVVAPSLITLILLVALPSRNMLMRLPLRHLTAVHMVRIPVELILWWLYHEGYVPRLMTFEGGNIDILAGLSAPFVVWLGFQDAYTYTQTQRRVLLIWNSLMILLLANILVRAVLSLPVSFQQFAFAQPNIAVNAFPFVWLPAVIVPIVIFCHVVSLLQLVREPRHEHSSTQLLSSQ